MKSLPASLLFETLYYLHPKIIFLAISICRDLNARVFNNSHFLVQYARQIFPQIELGWTTREILELMRGNERKVPILKRGCVDIYNVLSRSLTKRETSLGDYFDSSFYVIYENSLILTGGVQGVCIQISLDSAYTPIYLPNLGYPRIKHTGIVVGDDLFVF